MTIGNGDYVTMATRIARADYDKLDELARRCMRSRASLVRLVISRLDLDEHGNPILVTPSGVGPCR